MQASNKPHLYMYWHGSYLWRNKANIFLPPCYVCLLNNILSFTNDIFIDMGVIYEETKQIYFHHPVMYVH